MQKKHSDDVEKQYLLGYNFYMGKGVKQNYKKAVKWFKLAAEQGHPASQYFLGYCFANGHGVRNNNEAAVRWLKLSANQGNADAQYVLAFYFQAGLCVNKDVSEAMRLYKLAANQGSPKAQCAIGDLYYYGLDIPENYEEAVKWFKLAAEQGDADAQYHLGECYMNGKAVSKNEDLAVNLFRLSAENGNQYAQENLSKYYHNGSHGLPKDYNEALKWCRLSAEQGNDRMQTELGEFYLHGGCGVTQNYGEAVKWFRLASEHNTEARVLMGKCYYYGYGVKQDYKKAAKVFIDCSEDSSEAEYMLGECYYTGHGISQDIEKALKIFQSSYFSNAQNKMGYFHLIGRHFPKDYKKAWVSFMCAEISDGNADAIFHIGEMKYYGYGRSVDYEAAFKDFKRVAERGHFGAQYYLGICYYYGNGVPKDYNKALKWFKRAYEQGEDKLVNGVESPEMNVTFPDDIKRIILTCLHKASCGQFTVKQPNITFNSNNVNRTTRFSKGKTFFHQKTNPSKKNKNRFKIIIGLLILMLVVVILCTIDGKQRKMIRIARQSGSVELYEAYLNRFPHGRFSKTALDSITVISGRQKFAEAQQTKDINDYLDYMLDYPDGKYVEEAIDAILSLARQCGNASLVCKYANKADNFHILSSSRQVNDTAKWSERNHELANNLRKTAYHLADIENTISGWEVFKAWVSGEFESLAQEKIDSLKEIENRKWYSESYAWTIASSSGLYMDYKKYLEFHPDGAHARQAERKLIDMEVAKDFAGEHNYMPPMDKIGYSHGTQTKIEIHNNTQYELTILYSGPNSKRVVIPAWNYVNVRFTNGTYKISAKVSNNSIMPFVGTENLDGDEYEVSYYIETTRY